MSTPDTDAPSPDMEESSSLKSADGGAQTWWWWVLLILVFIIAVVALVVASLAYHLRLRIETLETENTTQNSRLNGIDADQVTQNDRLDAIEGDQKTQDARLDNIEAEQKTQNTNITNLQTGLTTQQNINNQQAVQIAQNNIQYERYERKQGLNIPATQAYFGDGCTLVEKDNLSPSIPRAFVYDSNTGNWAIVKTGMYDVGARVRFTSGGQYIVFCNVFRVPNSENIQTNLNQLANDTTTFSGMFRLEAGDQIQFRIVNLDAALPLIANDPAGNLQIYVALQQEQP